MNPAAEEILGKRREEFLGTNSVYQQQDCIYEDGSIFKGEDHPAMVALKTGETVRGVIMGVFNHKLARYRWISIDAVPKFTPGQTSPSEVFAIFQDITERKQAQETLKQREAIYRAIGESIDYGVWVCTPDGRNVYASDSFLNMVGITQQQCSDFGWGEVLHPDDSNNTIAAWKQCVRTGGLWDIEHRFRGSDGKWHYVLARGVPIRNDEGEITCWAGINLDITSRKQTEETLRQSEKQYRELFEHMGEAFAYGRIILEDGLPVDFTYLSVNQEFELQTGLKEVVGRKFTEVVPGVRQSNQALIEVLGMVSVTGKPERFEVFMEPLSSWFSVSVYSPEKEHFVAVFTNITERKNSEHDLRKALELLKMRDGERTIELLAANKTLEAEIAERKLAELKNKLLEEQIIQVQKLEAIGQLAGGIAHDFNNRLAAIANNTYILKCNLANDQRSLKFLDQITSSVENATTLTKGLLAFSRKQSMAVKPVDINELIQKVLLLVGRLIRENISIATELYAGQLIAQADSSQIENVLMNLVINASDALPDGGSITIRTKPYASSSSGLPLHGLNRKTQYVTISVSDNGTGMDEQTKQKIFDPFFTTKGSKGTGLGLAMAYGVLKQHNGLITVETQPCKGSAFTLYLPISTEPLNIQTQVQRDTDTHSGFTGHILLAEDDAEVREATRTLLQQLGYNVITADDGKDAIDKLRAQPDDIKLLILDVMMPDLNGKDVYHIAKTIKPGIKTLFMSGYSADLFGFRLTMDGDTQYLTKPTTPESLKAKLIELLYD